MSKVPKHNARNGDYGHLTATERAISDMRNEVIRPKKEIFLKDVEEEVRIQAKNLSAVVVQLQSISEKPGLNEIDRLLESIFNHYISVKAI